MERKRKRILVVDDNEAIHEDIHSILSSPANRTKDTEIENLEEVLFGSSQAELKDGDKTTNYIIDDAYQGNSAIEMANLAAQEGNPYALIFMDVRMPPGIDGIQAVTEIWRKHPQIEIVICTAYSDYSWDQIVDRIGSTDHLLFMKKPFDSIALRQTALSLTTKWDNAKKNKQYVEKLESEIHQRTEQLNQMAEHLKQLKRESEEMIITKENYFSSISSELQTPLNGILGITDLLLDTDLNEEQKDIAEIIKISGSSLLLVINDILNQSKDEYLEIEGGKIVFDIRTTLETVIDLVSIAAIEKEVEIACFIACRVNEFFIGDPFILRKILLLTLIQVIKTSESCNIAISVTNKRILENGKSELMIKVSKIGKNKNDDLSQKQVFQTNQVNILPPNNNCSKDIEQEEIERMVTKLDGVYCPHTLFDDKESVWFTCVFPIQEKVDFPSIALASTIIGMHCLVISDYSTGRKILSLHINHWGGNCREATVHENIAEKIILAFESRSPYDSVIIDLKNQDLSTYKQLSETICRVTEENNIVMPKLVCITANALRGDAQKVKEFGYIAYLTKPIKQSQLYKALLLVKSLKDKNQTLDPETLITKHYVDEFSPDYYKVLIVEENPTHLMNTITALTRLKVRCDVAKDKEIASEVLRSKSYDLVLIDCEKCTDAHVKFADQLKSKNQNLKTAFLIENSDPSSIEVLKNKGIADYLTKPLKKDALIKILQDNLQD